MAQALGEWALETFGHDFDGSALLLEAISHPSLHGPLSYQRLEFLGDRVLGLAVADQLLKQFPAEAEGIIARRFVKLVRKETLADVARSIGVPAQIQLELSAYKAQVHLQDGVCADVMEALIGALYLEAGLPAVHAFIEKHWSQLMEAESGARKDPKTRLQEWAQGNGLGLPHYEIISRGGPDHAPVFQVEATVAGYAPSVAEAGSKREAEKRAAIALWRDIMTPNEDKGPPA